MYAALVALFIAMFALPQQAQAQTKEAYVEKNLDTKTITFYYDAEKSSRKGIVYGINEKQTLANDIEILRVKRRPPQLYSMRRLRSIVQQPPTIGLTIIWF